MEKLPLEVQSAIRNAYQLRGRGTIQKGKPFMEYGQ
jgi:hypothetical protein